jgi:hypothetical protein
MKLTDAQKNALMVKIRGFFGGREFRCSVCNHDKWNLDDDVHELSNYKLGGTVAADLVAPVVLLTCTGCGHMHLFSAFKLGLVAHAHTAGKTSEGS